MGFTLLIEHEVIQFEVAVDKASAMEFIDSLEYALEDECDELEVAGAVSFIFVGEEPSG